MSYTILNTDGSILTILADGTIDQNTTSLTLIGRNRLSFGQEFNNNLIKLLGNSADSTSPNAPLIGQLWYDTVNEKIKVYDPEWGDFKSVTDNLILSGAPASNTSAGTTGQIAYGSTGTNFNYLYVCTATNAWSRIRITDAGPW